MNNIDVLIYQQLQQLLQQHQGNGLWVLDEQLLDFAPRQPSEQLALMTNRYDVFQRFSQQGWNIAFSDFDFSPWQEASVERIYYRISKEKAVVNHIINAARRCLAPGGELILLGAKNEGLKGFYDKAKALFADAELSKLGKGGMQASFQQGETAVGADLDDRNYAQLRPVLTLQGQEVLSKPGVFGWEKEDAGSAFLADQLASQLDSQRFEQVLDLGCGYGYLSLRYWQMLSDAERQHVRLYATDNNAAAVACCEQNFQRWGIAGQVLAADCGNEISGPVDLILCNPPFHQGFAVEGELTERFLAAAQRLLRSGGQAFFVVNRFIPLERKAADYFAEVNTFADNGSFKLIRLAAAH